MYLFVSRKARSWSKALMYFPPYTLHEVFKKMTSKVSQLLEEAKPLFRNFSKKFMFVGIQRRTQITRTNYWKGIRKKVMQILRWNQLWSFAIQRKRERPFICKMFYSDAENQLKYTWSMHLFLISKASFYLK